MDTLFVGNTGYLTKEVVKAYFPKDNIVVSGTDHPAQKEGGISFFDQNVMDDKFRRLFDTFSFERIIFLSHSLNKDTTDVGEVEELRRVCSLSQKHKVSQFVYLVSDEALVDVNNSDSVIYESTENICRYYSKTYQMNIRIVYCPYLICPSYKDDYWCRILHRVENREEVDIKALADEKAYFLKVEDLMDFFSRLFDAWDITDDENSDYSDGLHRIYLKSGAKTTYGEIREKIIASYPEAKISLSKSGIKGSIDHWEDIARTRYGWFARHDACWDFEEYIRIYKENFHIKPTLSQRIREKVKLGRRFLMLIELIAGALFVELYNYMSDGSVQFRMIDVRLMFVVLMSLVYGAKVGVLTAFIEIASLVFAYKLAGTNVVLLFYDPSNWIAFILLLVAAAICGYFKQKRDEDFSFINEENEALKSENAFISQLYHEAMDYKNRYKADLIGSRDGFGRIFDVVKKLSTTVPEEIFAQSIPVMEDVLNNRSVAIYTINDPKARFARLNVASDQISHSLKKSINLEEYSDVLETLKENDIWFNHDVKEGYPTYVAGIKSDGAVSVLIMIYHVGYLQISTYYSNLIRILSGLMENFIIKAWEYQRAVAAKTYVEGTTISKNEFFVQQFEIQKEMMDNKRTSFRLIKFTIEDKTIFEIDEMLQSKIRNNDLLGLGKDGNVYLIAAQVDESSEGIVLKRFKDMGLKCDIVENVA